jgi:hypothetical protein
MRAIAVGRSDAEDRRDASYVRVCAISNPYYLHLAYLKLI